MGKSERATLMIHGYAIPECMNERMYSFDFENKHGAEWCGRAQDKNDTSRVLRKQRETTAGEAAQSASWLVNQSLIFLPHTYLRIYTRLCHLHLILQIRPHLSRSTTRPIPCYLSLVKRLIHNPHSSPLCTHLVFSLCYPLPYPDSLASTSSHQFYHQSPCIIPQHRSLIIIK